MTTKHKIISAEQEPGFSTFQSENLVIEIPRVAPNPAKGTWINVRYMYDGKKDWLRIQTPEMYAKGIYRYEETSDPKLNLQINNKKFLEAKEDPSKVSEDEMINLKLEQDTIQIFNQICEKIKTELSRPEIISALQKDKDKKTWLAKVAAINLFKTDENEDGSTITYLSPKIISPDPNCKRPLEISKTEFNELVNFCEQRHLNYEETISSLKTCSCKGIGLIIIDSIFVNSNKDIFVQKKLKTFTITEKLAGNTTGAVIPTRFANKQIFLENDSE